MAKPTNINQSSENKGGDWSGSSGGSSGTGICGAQSCKGKESRFGFCTEHYEHFKFGLINKKGVKVPDWESKYNHYQSYLLKEKAKKAA